MCRAPVVPEQGIDAVGQLFLAVRLGDKAIASDRLDGGTANGLAMTGGEHHTYTGPPVAQPASQAQAVDRAGSETSLNTTSGRSPRPMTSTASAASVTSTTA